MNLTKLFQTQKVLRDRINYNEPDRFNKLILALLVEIGECANEWRGFKFWSKDQEPRVFVPNPNDICEACEGQGYLNTHLDLKDRYFCEECDGCGAHFHNPLLEEYVDGLHFVLELGLNAEDYDIDYTAELLKHNTNVYKENTITKQFTQIYLAVTTLNYDRCQDFYDELLYLYFGLGEMLGFTWEQIEEAYYKKNQINHQRQENGY